MYEEQSTRCKIVDGETEAKIIAVAADAVAAGKPFRIAFIVQFLQILF